MPCAAQGISDVCWRGDGLLLATASDDLSAKLWSAETGACLRTLRGHTHVVFSCCFSAGGNMLVRRHLHGGHRADPGAQPCARTRLWASASSDYPNNPDITTGHC